MALEQFDHLGHTKYRHPAYKAAVRELARRDRLSDRSATREQEYRDVQLGSLAGGGRMGLADGVPIPPAADLDGHFPEEHNHGEHSEEPESRPYRTPGKGKV